MMHLLRFLRMGSESQVGDYNEEEYDRILFAQDGDQQDINDMREKKYDGDGTCQKRTGFITDLTEDYGLIDKEFRFELDADISNLSVGQKVNYLVFKHKENEQWKVRKIEPIIEENWDDENIPREVGSPPEVGFSYSENPTIIRHIAGKIEMKVRRKLLVEPNNIEINLDLVNMDFLPVKGDWISMEAVVEVDGNHKDLFGTILDVIRIKPLRARVFSGVISHLEKSVSSGIIQSEVYFTYDVCDSGYIPKEGDNVLAHIIESEQGSLTWRAVFMIPLNELNIVSNSQDYTANELFKSKHGVEVVVSADNKSVLIGKTVTYIDLIMQLTEFMLSKLDIENGGEEMQTLVRVDANLKDKCQNEIVVKTDVSKPVVIKPNKKFSITVDITARSIGYFSEVVVLEFDGGWQMGTLLNIFVDDPKMEELTKNVKDVRTNKPKRRPQKDVLLKVATKNGFVVPGIRPIKPPSFVPVQMNYFPIPQNLLDIFLNETIRINPIAFKVALENVVPCLEFDLNYKDYMQRFHTLLHLEEIAMMIEVQKYNKDKANFTVMGEYLVFEMPGLSESRPSLLTGDKVIATDLRKKEDLYEGYIHKVRANDIWLKFGEAFHNKYVGGDVSLVFSQSRTSSRRCHQAINVVWPNSHLGEDWLFPSSLRNLKQPQIVIVGESPAYKDELPSGTFECCIQSEKNLDVQVVADEKPVVENGKNIADGNDVNGFGEGPVKEIEWVDVQKWKNRHESTDNDSSNNCFMQREHILKWVNVNLNWHQKEAVRNILKGEARPLPYIIFGPPGTGKTITVVETIFQIMRLFPESRLLIATPSNSSADLICERLLSYNLLKPGDLVRLVGYNYIASERAPPFLIPYCALADISAYDNNKYEPKKETVNKEGVKSLKRQAIGRHRITVGTCMSLGVLYTMGFPRNHFTHIIIDEAGQATEPETMIPLAFLNKTCGQVVLAGDPKQLGPIVMSETVKSYGLAQSLLLRIINRLPYKNDMASWPDTQGYDPRLITLLIYNYRSLPDIVNVFSSLFYRNAIIPKICPVHSEEAAMLAKIKAELPICKDNSIPAFVFHGVRGKNMQEEDSPSWFNLQEILQVITYLSSFYAVGLTPDEIGIITPYTKQVHKIRDILKSMDVALPKIGSVEEFQGQERNVIIISTVRSKEQSLLMHDLNHQLGFIFSPQRVNVAISRGRVLTVVIGDTHLLMQDTNWRHIITTCMSKASYTGCDMELMQQCGIS